MAKLGAFFKATFKHITSAFGAEDSRFKVGLGLKLLGIPLGCSTFIVFIFWIHMKHNYLFLEYSGHSGLGQFQGAFYKYILGEIGFLIPFALLFYVSLFFIGTYLGELLLRPFQVIGEYCEQKMEGREVQYHMGLFSEMQLLNRFSDYFFIYLNEAVKNKKLQKTVVPPYYSQIRGPFFDAVYFFHFGIFMLIVCIGVSAFMFMAATDIQERVVALAVQNINSKTGHLGHYFMVQSQLFAMAIYASIMVLFIGYMLLALSVYSQLAEAAFGVFSTMRAFMKGNYSARVHLIGHRHLRKHTRILNKYLDTIEKNYSDVALEKDCYPKNKKEA